MVGPYLGLRVVIGCNELKNIEKFVQLNTIKLIIILESFDMYMMCKDESYL